MQDRTKKPQDEHGAIPPDHGYPKCARDRFATGLRVMNPWFYFVFGRVDSAPRYGSNLIGCELAGQDQITKLSAEEIEDYARQHPDHVLWFGGPTPAIARAVAPEKPEGDQGAAEKSTPLQSRAKWHAELAAGWLREHPNHPHRIFMERLREAVESHPEKLAEEIVRFNEAVKSAEKLDGGTGAQEIPNLP